MSSYLLLENFEYGHYSLPVRKRESLIWKTQTINGLEMFCDPAWTPTGQPDRWFTVIFEGTKDKVLKVKGAREASWMLAGVPKSCIGSPPKRANIVKRFKKTFLVTA